MADTWRDDVTALEEALSAATEDRPTRADFVDGELGWVRHEREVLLGITNQIRAREGLPPVTADDIARVEVTALGHVDYVKKLAIACADLAHGRERGGQHIARESS